MGDLKSNNRRCGGMRRHGRLEDEEFEWSKVKVTTQTGAQSYNPIGDGRRREGGDEY